MKKTKKIKIITTIKELLADDIITKQEARKMLGLSKSRANSDRKN